MPYSLIVKDRPPNSTNPGSAVDAIGTFDGDVGSGSVLVSGCRALVCAKWCASSAR
jgi:hypothetical protein